MSGGLSEGHSFLRVFDQDSVDEILDSLGEILWEVDFGLEDFLVCLVLASSFVLEWSMTCCELIS